MLAVVLLRPDVREALFFKRGVEGRPVAVGLRVGDDAVAVEEERRDGHARRGSRGARGTLRQRWPEAGGAGRERDEDRSGLHRCTGPVCVRSVSSSDLLSSSGSSDWLSGDALRLFATVYCNNCWLLRSL